MLRVLPNQELDLSGCQCITDEGIHALARGCPGLRAVNMSSCYELTDAAFAALASCRHLRTVNACGCERVTNEGLCALVRGTRCVRVCRMSSVALPSACIC